MRSRKPMSSGTHINDDQLLTIQEHLQPTIERDVEKCLGIEMEGIQIAMSTTNMALELQGENVRKAQVAAQAAQRSSDLVSRRQGELEKCWKTGYEEMKAEFGKYLDVRETNLRQLLSSEITAIVRPLLESAIGNSAISKIQLDYEIHRSITLLQAHARRNLIRRKIRNLRAQFPFASLQAHALGALARRKISQVRDEHRQYPFVVTLQAGARGTLARFYASQLRDEYRKYSSVTSLQAHARGALQRRLMQRVRGDCRITTLGIKPLWAITILMLVFFATVILQHHLHTGDNLLRQPVVTNDSIQLAKMRSSFR